METHDQGSATPPEIARLYYTIASQLVLDSPVALQFVASQAKAGTSFVVSRFAAFAAQAQDGPVLLIDGAPPSCDPKPAGRKPPARPGLLEAFAADGRIDAAVAPADGIPGLHVAQFSASPAAVFRAGTGLIPAILDQARSRYRFIALDTPALADSAVALIFSRACDGVVLVVEADATTAAGAQTAVETIERSGGRILGLVFNKRRRHIPRWLCRWL